MVRVAVPAPPRTLATTKLLRLDADAGLPGHDVLQDPAYVGLDEILDAARANQRDDVPMDAAGVRYDGRRLLRTSALAEHEARRQVLEIEFAQLLDGDRLVVELPFLGRIIALRHPTQLDPGFLSGELWRPYAMKTDGVATRASGRAVLNEVAALTRYEHAQAKPGQFVVPDDIVPALRLGGLDNALGELSHGISPVRSPSPA